MRSTLIALALTTLSVIWWPPSPALAQDTKVARGTITSIGGRSLTVKVRGQEMTFSIDNKTSVNATGASTKSAQAAVSGKPGPHLEDVLKVGQAVAVTFTDVAGNPHATKVRAIPSAGASGGSVPGGNTMTSNGVVKSIGADSITITGGSGGGASFEQTFTIDRSTKVVGKGASTALAAKGGMAPFTDLVANGDHVSISYHKTGSSLHASDVRVTMKGSH
jgi:hypothetical protein